MRTNTQSHIINGYLYMYFWVASVAKMIPPQNLGNVGSHATVHNSFWTGLNVIDLAKGDMECLVCC